MQVATAGIVPPERMARQHTKLTEPGSANKK
jgi:hypothetical protein